MTLFFQDQVVYLPCVCNSDVLKIVECTATICLCTLTILFSGVLQSIFYFQKCYYPASLL